MKTTATITLDSEVKLKAMLIIRKKLDNSLSGYINQMLKKVVKKDKAGDYD